MTLKVDERTTVAEIEAELDRLGITTLAVEKTRVDGEEDGWIASGGGARGSFQTFRSRTYTGAIRQFIFTYGLRGNREGVR